MNAGEILEGCVLRPNFPAFIMVEGNFMAPGKTLPCCVALCHFRTKVDQHEGQKQPPIAFNTWIYHLCTQSLSLSLSLSKTFN
jgi:hypothetical protein